MKSTLNAFLAHAGVCSRRKAVDLIKMGRVKVNGASVNDPGYRVASTDKIMIDGVLIQAEKYIYIILNKPRDYITTVSDERGRKTVMELVADISTRIYPVGRLDRNTTGVLLLTNDGNLAHKLSHPQHEVYKEYRVHLNKNMHPGDLQKIKDGIILEDGLVQVDDIALETRSIVQLVIHSGRYRIVRRLFEHLGYEIEALDRVAYAGLTKQNLRTGMWRRLTTEEVEMLRAL